jgi:hypothetical protein
MAKETKIIKPQEGFQEKFVRSNIDFVVGGGVLNPQPLDSLVATPKGFVRMGDIKEGDIICDTKGGTQRVNFVLDKGLLPCVEFTLSDGRIVRSALNHHWLVKERHGKMLELSSQEIMGYMDAEENRRYTRERARVNRLRIPLCEPCYFEDRYAKERAIHPYVLGFLIGDGCISEKGHTIYISVPKEDYHVVEYIRSLGYNLVIDDKNDPECMHYAFRGGKIRGYLRDLGLSGKLSYNKFIPDAYKYAPVEDRIALLQGIFDSDGNCEKKAGQASFKTTSKQLVQDVQFIVRSIGGIANYTTHEACEGIIKGKTYSFRESYTLRVRTRDDKQLFLFDRKNKYAKRDEDRRWKVMVSIVSYRMVEDTEMRCLNVNDEDHLYLTDNFVITCNCGKTFAAVLSVAEASSDPNFRGVFLRNNLNDLKSGGGILDTFRDVYGDGVSIVESGDPSATFTSGAKCDITHVADQNRDKVMQRFKGRQYDYIYFDEGTGFTWETFTTIYSRNRGRAKWTGKVRMTTNPERDHWLRVFLDWYIGVDGFIREDREGVVRYFYMAGATVKDVVWGDTKEIVYKQCKADIDRKLAKINGKTGTATYQDMIKSFTFYLGRMSENKASLGNNSGYVGSVAISGGANSEQLLEGNWNVSSKDMIETAIPNDMARQVFLNDPATNGDRWITCDLADVGTDNFTAIAWDGFHIYDMLVVGKTTPRQNAELLLNFAKKHDIGPSHIVYDGTRGLYISDYIPDAIPFVSAKKSEGMYYLEARNLKDECFMRLAEAIKRGEFSIADEVANRKYEHQRLKETISIQNEFLEECAVVYFVDAGSGKKRMPSKKEMNAKLGKDRSMDIPDPCAMRMYPYLEYVYGEELIKTASWYKITDDDDDDEYDAFGFRKQTIYDDTLWS